MREKYLFVIIILSIFIFGFTKPEYKFTDYIDSDYEYLYSREWIIDVINKPVTGKITSFDVNEEGMIVMAISDNFKDYMLLYDNNGEYITGYKLNQGSSPFYVTFVNNSIGIIDVQGHAISIMDIKGNKIDLKKVTNSYAIFKYLNSKNLKTNNGVKYYTENNSGTFPINLFTYPTRMIIEDPEGNRKIILDGYIKTHIKTTIITSIIYYFFTGAFCFLVIFPNKISKNQ